MRRNLELDGYNKELGIAFEHQGEQHFKPVRWGGMELAFAINRFKSQQIRDQLKRDLCKANGVDLIEIPYTVKTKDLESYIRAELASRNLLPKEVVECSSSQK